MSGSRGKSGAGHCSSQSSEEGTRAGRGIIRKSSSVFQTLFLTFFLSFLVGLHCCDDLVGCRGDADFMEISHFCRKCFVVVYLCLGPQ